MLFYGFGSDGKHQFSEYYRITLENDYSFHFVSLSIISNFIQLAIYIACLENCCGKLETSLIEFETCKE
jgi:hypothetical protein